MKLLAATRSAGKQTELRRLLEAAGHEVVFPDDAGLVLVLVVLATVVR